MALFDCNVPEVFAASCGDSIPSNIVESSEWHCWRVSEVRNTQLHSTWKRKPINYYLLGRFNFNGHDSLCILNRLLQDILKFSGVELNIEIYRRWTLSHEWFCLRRLLYVSLRLSFVWQMNPVDTAVILFQFRWCLDRTKFGRSAKLSKSFFLCRIDISEKTRPIFFIRHFNWMSSWCPVDAHSENTRSTVLLVQKMPQAFRHRCMSRNAQIRKYSSSTHIKGISSAFLLTIARFPSEHC